MPPRYIPKSDARLAGWLENFQTAAKARGKVLGLDDVAVQGAAAAAAALVDAIRTDEQKLAEWRAANARTAQLREQTLPGLTRLIDRAATSDNWSAEDAHAFMAVGSARRAVRLDASFKPAFRARVHGGKVRILWTRGPLDGVRIESRLGGETEWKTLGIDTRPPFEDPRPLPKAGTAEQREYRLIGLRDDQDVGTPSDIVHVTVGG